MPFPSLPWATVLIIVTYYMGQDKFMPGIQLSQHLPIIPWLIVFQCNDTTSTDDGLLVIVITNSTGTAAPTNNKWNCTHVNLGDVVNSDSQLPVQYFLLDEWEEWLNKHAILPSAVLEKGNVDHGSARDTQPQGNSTLSEKGKNPFGLHSTTPSVFYGKYDDQSDDEPQQLMLAAPIGAPSMPTYTKFGFLSWNVPTGQSWKFRLEVVIHSGLADNWLHPQESQRFVYLCPSPQGGPLWAGPFRAPPPLFGPLGGTVRVPLLLESNSFARDGVFVAPANEAGMSYTWNALLGLICMSAVARIVCEIPHNNWTHAYKMVVTAIVVVPALACVAMHWTLLLLGMSTMNLTVMTGLISLGLVLLACFKTASIVIEDVPLHHAPRMNVDVLDADPLVPVAKMRTRSARNRAHAPSDPPPGPFNPP